MKLRTLTFIFLLLLPIITYGAKIQKGRPYLVAPVYIDSEELGTLWIYPKFKKDNELVELAPFIRFLSPFLQNKDSINEFLKVNKDRFVHIDKLTKLGTVVFFDEEELAVRVSIRPDARKSSQVNLFDPLSNSIEIDSKPSLFSGYSNFYISQPISNQEEEDGSLGRSELNVVSDIGLNLAGVLLETGVNYRERAANKYKRANTRLVKDLPKHLTRVYVGELEYEATSLQSDGDGIGVMVSRLASISPDSISQGEGESTITLKRQSVVEVLLNGAVIHKGKYPAGPVDFSNYPFASGTNDILFRITDSMGKVEVVSFSKLYDGDLLKSGFYEYSLAQTAKFEDDESDKRRYDFSKIGGTYFTRIGISSDLTAGLNFQYDNRSEMVGAESIFLNKYGVLETHFAQSRNHLDQFGSAVRFNIRNHDQYRGKSPYFTSRTVIELHSRKYQRPGANAASTRSFFSSHLSKRILDFSTVGFGGSFKDYYDQDNELELRLSLSSMIERNINMTASLTKNFSEARDRELRATVGLTWYPKNTSSSVMASFDSRNSEGSVGFRRKDSVSNINLYSTAEVKKSAVGDQFETEGQLSGSRGEFTAHYSYFDSKASGANHLMNLEGRFAVAFAGDTVALGRTINDSFAIVKTSPSPRGFTLPVKAGGSYSGGSVDMFGPALLSELTPYSRYEVSYDINSLPNSYRINREFFGVYPEYKRGVLLESNLEERVAVIAKIYDNRGVALKYSAGDLLDLNNKAVGRFFANRKGRIYIESVRPGKYKLILDDERFETLDITVGRGKNGIAKLGPFKFTIKGSAQ